MFHKKKKEKNRRCSRIKDDAFNCRTLSINCPLFPSLINATLIKEPSRNFTAKLEQTHDGWNPIMSLNIFFLFSVTGRTHDSTYTLYRLGERLSSGIRLYVETGRTDGMDADGDSPNSLHSFTGPPVPQGEGTSIARAFLDGNHTLISIMARINPSPDWFVGVDSFQLCVEGNWVDTVTVEVIIVDRDH